MSCRLDGLCLHCFAYMADGTSSYSSSRYRVEYTTPYRTPAGERFLGQAILIVTVGAAVNQDGHGSASGVKRVRDALARERAICAELGKVREF